MEWLFYILFGDPRLTTLDQWQEAVHVIVVEMDDLVHFEKTDPLYKKYSQTKGWAKLSSLSKLKILHILTPEKLEKDVIYTAHLPLKKGEKAIVTLGPFVSTDKMKPIFTAYAALSMIRDKEGGAAQVYAHPWHDPWQLGKNKTGELYIPDCVDGFTKEPLINPSINRIKEYAQLLGKDPQTEAIGWWRPEIVSKSKTKRCRHKRFNPPIDSN